MRNKKKKNQERLYRKIQCELFFFRLINAKNFTLRFNMCTQILSKNKEREGTKVKLVYVKVHEHMLRRHI